MTAMEPTPIEPEADGQDIDRLIWRIGQLVSLALILGELAWFYNHTRGGQPARTVTAWSRQVGRSVNLRWRRLSAPMVARREAPLLIWQAWRHAEGETL